MEIFDISNKSSSVKAGEYVWVSFLNSSLDNFASYNPLAQQPSRYLLTKLKELQKAKPFKANRILIPVSFFRYSNFRKLSSSNFSSKIHIGVLIFSIFILAPKNI